MIGRGAMIAAFAAGALAACVAEAGRQSAHAAASPARLIAKSQSPAPYAAFGARGVQPNF